MFRKRKVEEPDIQLEDCVGAIGEVFREDNFLLFVGRIEEYDSDLEELHVVLHKGTHTPAGVILNMPVKIQVHLKNRWGTLLILYGNVTHTASSFWKVQVREMKTCVETRRAFRQKVKVNGKITWGEDNAQEKDCQLEDISLVGVAFFARADLENGTHVWLHLPHLVEGGASYQIECEVVLRKKSDNGPAGAWRYGCNYVRLREREENQLCKDILALQARDIRGEA